MELEGTLVEKMSQMSCRRQDLRGMECLWRRKTGPGNMAWWSAVGWRNRRGRWGEARWWLFLDCLYWREERQKRLG